MPTPIMVPNANARPNPRPRIWRNERDFAAVAMDDSNPLAAVNLLHCSAHPGLWEQPKEPSSDYCASRAAGSGRCAWSSHSAISESSP